jgi:hypothetical protein
MAPRNDEAEIAAQRLDEVMTRLTAVDGPEAEPIDFRELARRLFPVERMFESLGFVSVAREVSYVENALDRLQPKAETDDLVVPSPEPLAAPSASTLGEKPLDRTVAVVDRPPTESRSRVRPPMPVVAMLLVLISVVLVSTTLVLRRGRARRTVGETTTLDRTAPTPTVALSPTRETEPPTTGWELDEVPTPRSRGLVAEEISKARLALRGGDLEAAISHVSAAARIDMSNSLVLEAAQTVVDELILRSDLAAENGDWETADRLLEQARELSVRFSLSVAQINRTAHRHASMDRFRRIQPGDVAAIRAAAGRRVKIVYTSGKVWEGRIHGVTGSNLEIDQYTEVGGGGKLYYVDQVPLALIRELRVYED